MSQILIWISWALLFILILGFIKMSIRIKKEKQDKVKKILLPLFPPKGRLSVDQVLQKLKAENGTISNLAAPEVYFYLNLLAKDGLLVRDYGKAKLGRDIFWQVIFHRPVQ